MRFIMKKLGFFNIFFLLFAVACLVSCGEDEVEIKGLNDFYVEVEVSGGGLSDAERHELQTDLNSIDFYISKASKEEAIGYFDEFISEMTYEYYDGLSWVEGTLTLRFILKTTKGVKAKSSSIYITNKTAWSKLPQVREIENPDSTANVGDI